MTEIKFFPRKVSESSWSSPFCMKYCTQAVNGHAPHGLAAKKLYCTNLKLSASNRKLTHTFQLSGPPVHGGGIAGLGPSFTCRVCFSPCVFVLFEIETV